MLGYVALQVLAEDQERMARWAYIALFAVAGFFFGGLPGVVVGGLFGWFFGWFTYWIGLGRYRAKLVPYLTPGQVLWYYSFRVICGAIFVFLITPIIVVMPLSFNAEDFFTFTPEMLRFDPAGYSLRHYRDFLTNPEWTRAVKNSLLVAPVATIISVSLGTLAAIGKLGVDGGSSYGFDIKASAVDSNTAFLVVDNTLHTVDLKTGAATSVGALTGFDGMLGDIAILP